MILLLTSILFFRLFSCYSNNKLRPSLARTLLLYFPLLCTCHYLSTTAVGLLVDNDDDEEDEDERSWGGGALIGRGSGVGVGTGSGMGLDQPRTRGMKGDKWEEISHHKGGGGGGSGSMGSGDRATNKIGIEPPSSSSSTSSTGSGTTKMTGSSNNNGGSSSNNNNVNNNSNSDGKTSMVGSLWSQLVRMVDRYL